MHTGSWRVSAPAYRGAVVMALLLTCSCSALVGAQTSTPGSAQPRSDMTGKVMTVNGPIDPNQLGRTLLHEHVFADFTLPYDEPDRWALAGRARPAGATDTRLYHAPLTLNLLARVMLGAMSRDNWQLTDEAQQRQEVADFRRVGGGTIVDVTSTGLTRRPDALRRVSQATGINLVMGSSWYRPGWYTSETDARSVESLSEEIVHDIVEGVDGSGIRAGIIGEIGTGDSLVDDRAERILRASARASRRTGAAITLDIRNRQHSHILDLLATEGADLARVILGHTDLVASDTGYLTPLLQRGATLEFDLLGRPPLVTRTRPLDRDVARTIVTLINAGYGDRIVLSQDVSEKTHLKAYGGTGYAFLEEQFLPYLKRQGVTDAQIRQLVVDNPKRLLTLTAPR